MSTSFGPTPPDNPLYRAAVEYIGRGWFILPLKPGRKDPLTEHGVNDSSNQLHDIQRWWTQYPDANIGIDLGRSGYWVRSS